MPVWTQLRVVEQTVGDVGEFGLIELIRQGIGTSKYVLIGPGDDAAQVATNDGNFLVSTDLLVEGRHFRRDWSSAYEIGRKAAACNLSDINAMGGVATALTIGFGAPADLPVSWVVDMVHGIRGGVRQGRRAHRRRRRHVLGQDHHRGDGDG